MKILLEGPAGGSFFVLSKERDEKGRPMGFLTRKEARELKAQEEQEKWQAQRDSDSVLASFRAKVESESD